MFRFLLLATALCCVAGSGSAQTPAADAPAAAQVGSKPDAKKPAPRNKSAAKTIAPPGGGSCQIGVISAIGDVFVVQKVGITVFGNEYTEVPIETWGLDDIVVARLRAAVGPGVGVRKISYSKAALAEYDHPAPALFRNDGERVTAMVRQSVGNAACDRIIVVSKLTAQIGGTNQTNRGLGVMKGTFTVFGYPVLFANFRLTEVDGKTFAVRDSPSLKDLGSALARSLDRFAGDPLEKLDDSAFPEPPAEAANSAVLRDRMRTLLSARLDKALAAHLQAE